MQTNCFLQPFVLEALGLSKWFYAWSFLVGTTTNMTLSNINAALEPSSLGHFQMLHIAIVVVVEALQAYVLCYI